MTYMIFHFLRARLFCFIFIWGDSVKSCKSCSHAGGPVVGDPDRGLNGRQFVPQCRRLSNISNVRRLVAQGALTVAASGEEAGVGLPSLAEPGARAATTARQKDAGSRDPQGGVRTRHGVKKRLRLPPSPPKDGFR